ncbi:MAG: oligosaccharide flippase family protein [Deltaproteobacteria bacterium]|nr:oligosaccharide flippase family protein [Deltaproteobacteria bacterium]
MVAPGDDSLRRDVVWNLVPVALLAIVGLGLNFVIGGWWGPAALGVFNLVTMAVFSLAIVGAGGLQYAVLRAVAEDASGTHDRDHVAAVVVGALVPNLVLAALATVIFVAIRHPVGRLLGSDAVAEGMLWAAPGVFCFAINKVLFGVVNGLRRMRAFAIYTSLRYLLIAAGLVLARVEQVAGDQLAVIWTFTEGTLLLVLLGELLATVKLWRGRGWLAHARAHLDYGARGVLATLALEVNSKLDVWMLGVALPETQVGIYALASALYEGVLQLAVVLQNNFNPLLARHLAHDRRAEVATLARSSRRWFVPAAVAVCALSALVYPFAIPWLIGNPAFIAGAIPFAILMAGVALASPYLPFTQLLLMASRPGWHTLYVLGTVGIAFLADLLLVPAFAEIGVAIGTALGTVASAVLLRVLARWRLGVRI